MKRSILVSSSLSASVVAPKCRAPRHASSTTAPRASPTSRWLAAARAAQGGRAEAGDEGSLGPRLLPAGRRHLGLAPGRGPRAEGWLHADPGQHARGERQVHVPAAALAPQRPRVAGLEVAPRLAEPPPPLRGYARGHATTTTCGDRLRPRRREGGRAGRLLRQARRRHRARARARRRVRQHRHAAVEDAARDRALPLRLPPARALRPAGRAHRARRRCRSSCAGRSRCSATKRQRIRGNLERHDVDLLDGTAALRRRAHGRDHARRRPAAHASRSDVVLIATGSTAASARRSSRSKIPSVDDSDSILRLDRIPERMVVLGGGVIGCEYASMFAALGTQGAPSSRGATDPRLPRRRGERAADHAAARARLRASCFKREVVEVGAQRRRRCTAASPTAPTSSASGCFRRRPRRQHAQASASSASARRRRARPPQGRRQATASPASRGGRVYAAGDVIGFPGAGVGRRWSRGASPSATPSASSTSTQVASHVPLRPLHHPRGLDGRRDRGVGARRRASTSRSAAPATATTRAGRSSATSTAW